jgi:hypothetical protein
MGTSLVPPEGSSTEQQEQAAAFLSAVVDAWNTCRALRHRVRDEYDSLLNRCDQLFSFNSERAYQLSTEAGRSIVAWARAVDGLQPVLTQDELALEVLTQYLETARWVFYDEIRLSEQQLEWLDRQHALVNEELAK